MASIMPLPVITTGTPGAAMEVGVMDVSTGLVASVMHASHATRGEARFAQMALAFSTKVELAYCNRPAAAATVVFQPMHRAASVRPVMHCSAPQPSPPTYAFDTRVRWPIHSAVPDSVMLMMLTPELAGGSSVTSVDDAISVGSVNTDGSTPLTSNRPASCTMTEMSTPSSQCDTSRQQN